MILASYVFTGYSPIKFMPSCYCETITSEEDFLRLEDEWRALSCESAYPSLFSSWEWVFEWWQHFGPELRREYAGTQLHVVCARGKDGDLIGIAPFYETRSGVSWLLGRTLMILGEVLESETRQGMTEEPTALLRKNREQEAVAALLAHLNTSQFPHWNHFFLPFFSEQALALPRPFLQTQGDNRGPQTVSLPRTWAEYRRSLSRSMRDNLAYYPNRLTKHGHTCAVRLIRDPQQIEEAVDILVDLHRRRATGSRGRPHVNHIPEEVNVQFLKTILRRLSETENAFLAVLEVGGRPVAAQAFLTLSGTLTVYYSGYDVLWYDYSPLTILLAEVLKEEIAQGVQTINFLQGAQPWKTRWKTQQAMPLQRAANPQSFCLDRQSLHYFFGPVRRQYLKRLMMAQPWLLRMVQRQKCREIQRRQDGKASLLTAGIDSGP